MKVTTPIFALAAVAAITMPSAKAQGLDFFVSAMKSSPGCLGLENAKVQGGRLALFGWFDSAANADAFINGPICQGMRQMAKIPDTAVVKSTPVKGPVLVIASFTPSKDPKDAMGLGQLALERMTPVTGGFAYGGRFAPETVKVPGLISVARSTAKPTPTTQSDAAPKPLPRGNTMIADLQKSPGCLGVAAMQCDSGKLVIVAWFEDKKATLAWYNGAAHGEMMAQMAPPTRPPLAEVSAGTKPIIVMATVTNAKETDPTLGMALSQISVELYTAAPGGFARGGGFGPAKK
ncbi:hypothetical protein [Armatimonas sp.]|uniref:hypothetical protein n=1 Tax=Armatimonas sp. TaxID=1872638 RepID=UPI00286AC4DB|nr:hypothetical protein [Armatimonas sp.]